MRPAAAKSHRRRTAGSLSLDLGVALGLLTMMVIPFAYSYLEQQNQLRQAHHRAVATELVDGEAEVLAAGALNAFPDGEAEYPVTGAAAGRLQGIFSNATGAAATQTDSGLKQIVAKLGLADRGVLRVGARADVDRYATLVRTTLGLPDANVHVLADDHASKSSTVPHQSEPALIAGSMPVKIDRTTAVTCCDWSRAVRSLRSNRTAIALEAARVRAMPVSEIATARCRSTQRRNR